MIKKENKIKWEEFLSGNDNSYSWLYNEYFQILYRYGLRFTSNTEVIKDAIQEVFTKLYRDRKHLVVPENVDLYLMISFKNHLLRILSRRDKFFSESLEGRDFHLEPTVEEQFIDDEDNLNRRKKVQAILSLLSPRQREIIYYRFLQDMKLPDICQLMELNYQSALNLIQRALKTIRENF